MGVTSCYPILLFNVQKCLQTGGQHQMKQTGLLYNTVSYQSQHWKYRKWLAALTLGWVFKDYFCRHSNLCQHENRFLRAEVGIETSFHAGVGQNADGNYLSVDAEAFYGFINRFAIAEKNSWNCDGGGGGGVHSCRNYVEKHSTNLDMSKKALVKKISMLKSKYIEAGHEQPGYKILLKTRLGTCLPSQPRWHEGEAEKKDEAVVWRHLIQKKKMCLFCNNKIDAN